MQPVANCQPTNASDTEIFRETNQGQTNQVKHGTQGLDTQNEIPKAEHNQD